MGHFSVMDLKIGSRVSFGALTNPAGFGYITRIMVTESGRHTIDVRWDDIGDTAGYDHSQINLIEDPNDILKQMVK